MDRRISSSAIPVLVMAVAYFSQPVAGDSLADVEMLGASAERIAKERDDLGEKLRFLLADREAPVEERLRAAEALGALRYLPAIPTLIQYIDLELPVVGEFREPPPARALRDFGEAAVLELVRAYLAEGLCVVSPGRRRQHAILFAIRGRSDAAARTYALGFAAQGDAAARERVDWFLEELTARQQNRRPGHPIPVHNPVDKPPQIDLASEASTAPARR
jgi:hypothetical protein